MGLGEFERGRACCGSSARDRRLAGLFLPLLAGAKVPEDSLSRFFQIAFDRLAVGINAFKALHCLKAEDFSGEWLELDLPRRRNIFPEPIVYRPLLPNVFRGSPSVGAFLETPWPEFMSRVIEELIRAYGGDPAALKQLMEWREHGSPDLPALVEAVLPLRFPPLLIAYANFALFNCALPAGIDLDAKEIVALPSEKEEREDSRWFKEFHAARKGLFGAMKAGRWTDAQKIVGRLRGRVPVMPHPGSRILCRILLHLLDKPIRQRNPKVKDLYRLVSEMPRVHRMVQAKARQGKIYGITLKALGIYRVVAKEEGRPVDPKLFATLSVKSKPVPRLFVLVPPTAVRKRYVEPGPCPVPPEGSEGAEEYIRVSAWRALGNVLAEFGGRCISLLGIELRHIEVTDEVVDMIVPSSKGEKQKDCALPAGWLWPAQEVAHLRRFIAWLKETGRYRPEARLTELAGLGRFDGKDSSDKAHRAVSRALFKRFGDGKSAETHLGRISFASWFPVRCLVTHHRWLLQEPILACIRDDPWFTDEALDRLLHLYPNEAYSMLEIERRILMQSTCREIATAYCRTFPLLAALWSIPQLQREA